MNRIVPIALVAVLVASALLFVPRAADATPVSSVGPGPVGSPGVGAQAYRWVDSTADGCKAPSIVGSGIPAAGSAAAPAKGCPMGWDELAPGGCKVATSVTDNGAGGINCFTGFPNFNWFGTSWNYYLGCCNYYYWHLNENGFLGFSNPICCYGPPPNLCGPTTAVPAQLPAPNFGGSTAPCNTNPASRPTNIIAAFWTNLKAFPSTQDTSTMAACWDVPAGPTTNFGHIWASTSIQGTTPNRYVVLEWDRVLVAPDDSGCKPAPVANRYATFQIKLWLDMGNVDVIYKSADSGGQPVSLGIQNTGTLGLNYCSPTVAAQCGGGAVLNDHAVRYYRSNILPLSGAVTVNEECVSPVIVPGASECSDLSPENFGYSPDYGEADQPAAARYCLSSTFNLKGTASGISTCTPASPLPGPMVYTPWRNYNGDGSATPPSLASYSYRARDPDTNVWTTASGTVSITINPVNDPPTPQAAAQGPFGVLSGDSLYILPPGVTTGATDPEQGVQRNTWYCTNSAAPPYTPCAPGWSNCGLMDELGPPGVRTITDGVTTSGSNIITSATANFKPSDLGAAVTNTCPLFGSLPTTPIPNTNPTVRIVAVNSPNSVTLSNNANQNNAAASLTIAPVFVRGAMAECPGFNPSWLPQHGTVSFSHPSTGAATVGVAPNGGFNYQADVYTGPDTFRYCLFDGTDYSLTPGTVSINIAPAPVADFVARSDTYTVPEGSGSVIAVGANAPSVNDDASGCDSGLQYVITNPTGGAPAQAHSFSWDPASSHMSYVAKEEWGGDDAFWYQMTCASPPISSNVASVRIKVTPKNDPPVLGAWLDYVDTIQEDNGVIGAAAPPPYTRIVNNFMTGVSPGDGVDEILAQGVRAVIVSQTNPGLYNSDIPCPANYAYPMTAATCPPPQRGPTIYLSGVSGQQKATLTYTTKPDANGVDHVCFRLMDDGGTQNGGVDLYPAPSDPPLCFDITVNPVGDVPRAVQDAYTIYQDQVLDVPHPASNWPVPLPAEAGVLLKGTPDTDVDGETIIALLYGGPAGVTPGTLVSFDTSGAFRYIPPPGFTGVDTFRYYLKDSSGAISAPTTVSITILPNTRPVASIDSFTWQSPDTAPRVGDAISASGSCYDADGDAPLVLVWDFGDGFSTTTGTSVHPYSTPGDYNVVLTCWDPKGDSGMAARTVNVVSAGTGISGPGDGTGNGPTGDPFDLTPPGELKAQAGPDTEVKEGSTFALHGMASEEGMTSWKWTQVAGPMVTLGNHSKQDAWFVAPILKRGETVKVVMSLVVSDGSRKSLPDLVNFTIVPANHPPVARPDAPFAAEEGDVVTLDGSFSSDPDGDALTYAWSARDAPDVTIADATAEKATFTVPAGATGRTISIMLEVSDGKATHVDTVQVVVVPDAYDGPGFTAVVGEGGLVTATPIAPGSRFVWDFGDGTPSATSTGPVTHTYATAGQYVVWMTAQDAGSEVAFHDTVLADWPGAPAREERQRPVLDDEVQADGSPIGWILLGIGLLLVAALVAAVLVILRRRT